MIGSYLRLSGASQLLLLLFALEAQRSQSALNKRHHLVHLDRRVS